MGLSAENQPFLRDFFFELFRDSENMREHFQFDRECWFSGLELHRKEEILFELEMYLRAIGCFFNLHNQSLADQEIIARDFTAELVVLSAALERGIQLSQRLFDRGHSNSLHFQSYLESRAAPDHLRLQLLRRTLDQRRPEESLFLLNRCFRDLRKLVDHLVKRPPCTFQLFHHFGQIVLREIAFNRFFNPLLILEFRAEYDRLRSVVILDSLRTIEQPMERRASYKTYLALFRLLHYLRYVPRQGNTRVLHRALILFILFRSEASSLAGFMQMLADQSASLSAGFLAATMDVAAEIRAVLSQLFGEGLVQIDLERSKIVGDEEHTIKSSRDVLEGFLKRCIARFVQVQRPDTTVERLFDNVQTRSEQSVRLRADLWLFRKIVDQFINRARERSAEELRVSASLERYSDYFLQTSLNFLRYADLGSFERFHAILAEGQRHEAAGVWQTRLMEDTLRFRDTLEETYDSVCRRAELVNLDEDIAELQKQLDRWLQCDQGGQAAGVAIP